jgi:hypothetical protein
MNRTGLDDTSPEARSVLDNVYRRMSPARKWFLLGDLYRMGRNLHAAGVRLRDPDASDFAIRDDWIATHLRCVSSRESPGTRPMDQPLDNLRVIREVLDVFHRLGIAYAVGGSMASGIHGITRYTADADVSVEPFDGLEDQVLGSFGPDYDLSLDAIRQALRDRSTFNIINTSIDFKIDVFIRKDRPFEMSLMARRVSASLGETSDRPIRVVSAEDSILLKLERYRLAGEISERQWSDILGVMRVQCDRLDQTYLEQWAEELGVGDLLADARRDAAG